jgi:hypothetical protein
MSLWKVMKRSLADERQLPRRLHIRAPLSQTERFVLFHRFIQLEIQRKEGLVTPEEYFGRRTDLLENI